MKALQISAYGLPDDVVKLMEVPSVGAPAPDEIIIDVESSPIEPTDLLIIAGHYGYQPELPHILGAQGVGVVSAVGSNVKHLKEGDRTLVPPLSNAWVQQVKTTAPWLRPLPDGNVDQYAMLGINPPTAYLLLTEFVNVKPGEWIIHNGANSGVGRSIIPIAKTLGIKTVNIVRREELVDEIKALGGDIVLVDGPDLPQRIAEATGKAKIELALDCIGDTATQRLLDSIVVYGTVVVYAQMSGKQSIISNAHMVFNSKRIQGFWLVNWFFAQQNYDKIISTYEKVTPLVASGDIVIPVAGTFTLAQYSEALTLASKFSGKAILKPNA